MVEETEYIEKDNENVYALYKGKEIHISEAPESGAKGYYCLGCGKELQAVAFTKIIRDPYFRHHPENVPLAERRKCTYKDETFRHKLAKSILLERKYIKVPAVFKYPPIGENGPAYLIKKNELIEAHSVKQELTFYEDEEGNVKWGSNSDLTERNLLIKPDIAFFNSNDEPILLIELVATHKVTEDKKVKLGRLGINTIQVNIPKDTPEAIAESLSHTSRIKWIYNYEEQSNTYLRVSQAGGEAVLRFDEQQRKLFEESYTCRKSQLNNLIRGIKKCLGSKPYNDVEREIRDEISRVEKNTEREKSELDGLREIHRNAVIVRLKSQKDEYSREEEDIIKQEGEFEAEYNRLEQEYQIEIGKLSDEERRISNQEDNIIREVFGSTEDEGTNGESISRRRKQIEKLTAEVGGYITGEEDEIKRIESEEGELPERFKRDGIEVTVRIGNEERANIRRINQATQHQNGEIEKIEREEDSLPEIISGAERELFIEFNESEERIRETDEDIREFIDSALASRNVEGNEGITRRIREILSSRKSLTHFIEVRKLLLRTKDAIQSIKTRTYLDWVK